jgi:hypothetical protein
LEEDPQRLQDILDGMGTGTARIIIDREASQRISEDFNLIRKKKRKNCCKKLYKTAARTISPSLSFTFESAASRMKIFEFQTVFKKPER